MKPMWLVDENVQQLEELDVDVHPFGHSDEEDQPVDVEELEQD